MFARTFEAPRQALLVRFWIEAAAADFMSIGGHLVARERSEKYIPLLPEVLPRMGRRIGTIATGEQGTVMFMPRLRL